jgi:nitrogen regulatory protein P-II 1
MKEIKAIIQTDRLSVVLRALHKMPDVPGVTVSVVRGFGRRYPPEGGELMFDEVHMTKVEIVVPSAVANDVVSTIERAAHSGNMGDGNIFVIPVEQAVKIRSGQRDGEAL